jgi:hypothetical protein
LASFADAGIVCGSANASLNCSAVGSPPLDCFAR